MRLASAAAESPARHPQTLPAQILKLHHLEACDQGTGGCSAHLAEAGEPGPGCTRQPGPGYIHFPVGGAFDHECFDQLTAEQVVTRRREGLAYRVWVLPSGKRNEVLDCTVLCLLDCTVLCLAAYKSAPNRRLEEQLAAHLLPRYLQNFRVAALAAIAADPPRPRSPERGARR